MAAKVLRVGKNRVYFDKAHISEIKEAITKQDIRDLFNQGIIGIKEIKGRKSKERRTTRRGPGKIKIKVKLKKRGYIILTRKLRKYIKELKKQNKMDLNKYNSLRKEIRARVFKDKAHLKNHLEGKI